MNPATWMRAGMEVCMVLYLAPALRTGFHIHDVIFDGLNITASVFLTEFTGAYLQANATRILNRRGGSEDGGTVTGL